MWDIKFELFYFNFNAQIFIKSKHKSKVSLYKNVKKAKVNVKLKFMLHSIKFMWKSLKA